MVPGRNLQDHAIDAWGEEPVVLFISRGRGYGNVYSVNTEDSIVKKTRRGSRGLGVSRRWRKGMRR